MKKGNELVTIGALALLGYVAYKYLSGNASDIFGGGGAPSGVVGGNTVTDNQQTPYRPNSPQGYGNIQTTMNTPINVAYQQQAWAGGVYGAPGQPSLTFLRNIVSGPSTPAQQAVGSAPPRVVAKIKAGRIY